MCQLASPKRGFSTRGAARYIDRSESYLEHGRVEGPIEGRAPSPPFIKVGRSIIYLREDLDSWLDRFPRHQYLINSTRKEIQ